MEITSNLHLIPRVTANAYLLVDRDGLTLIDTGIPGSAGKILRYIRHLGFSPRNLNRILLTHADYDHAGSLAALKRVTGARVYASVFEARAVAQGKFPRSLKSSNPFLKPLLVLAERLGRISPAHVDEHLSDGQMLPVLGGLRVVDSHGHTPGHLSFYLPLRGILFTGDSIVTRNGKLVGSQGVVTWDQTRADAAIDRQLMLTIWMICAGHGAVMIVNQVGRLLNIEKKLVKVPIRVG